MHELYIVYKNIFELIKYREYSPESDTFGSENEFILYSKSHDPIILSGHRGTRTLKVFLIQNKEVLSRPKLPGIIMDNSSPQDEIILVFEKGISAAYNSSIIEAERTRHSILKSAQKIWYMTYDNLKTVIPRYVLNVGEYHIMTEDEKNLVLKMNRIELSSWPKVYEYDPLNLWLGGLPGQMLEYNGPSETGGKTTKYFEIVSSPRYSSK